MKLSQICVLTVSRLFLRVGGSNREGNKAKGPLHQETRAAAELSFASHGVRFPA